MSSKKSAAERFADYQVYQQHPTNALLQRLTAPVIFVSLLGLFWSLPMPAVIATRWPGFTWMVPAVMAALFFYSRLSLVLGAGMFVFIVLALALLSQIAIHAPWSLGAVCFTLFALAWTAQMVGRYLEGRSPSLARNALFILIGPAWLVNRVLLKFRVRL